MAKQKKKRNKPYRGADARGAKPNIIRVEAANRSTVGQWWYEKKRLIRALSIAFGILLALVLIIVGIVGIFI